MPSHQICAPIPLKAVAKAPYSVSYTHLVQKLRDGEALGGSSMTAAQAFGAPQPAAPAQPMYAASQPQAYAQPQQPAGQAPWGQPTAAPVNPLTGMPY